jgi:hypothetical protein
MHEKLSKSGLVVISLSVDETDNKAAALEFLKKQKAVFQNFLLVDKLRNDDEGDKKLLHSVPPIVHVFGRDGKLAKTFEGKEISGLDDLVKKLLEKK